MKNNTFTIIFLSLALYMAASSTFPADTTFHYNNRKVVISENDNEINISVYHRMNREIL
jgi:hypothetical protein